MKLLLLELPSLISFLLSSSWEIWATHATKPWVGVAGLWPGGQATGGLQG